MRKAGKGRGTPRAPLSPLYRMPLLMILLCVITAKLILWGKLPEVSLDHIPYIIGSLVAIYGAYKGTRLAPRRRLLWGITNAILFALMLVMGNILFFGEPFSDHGQMFLWIIGGGIIGSFVANIKKGKIA